MALISLQDATIAFGADPILDQAKLIIDAGERIGLIGRNGTGKSTLLNILSGELSVDSGEVNRRNTLVVSRLIQEVPSDLDLQVQSVVARGDKQKAKMLEEFYESTLSHNPPAPELVEGHRLVSELCSRFNLAPSKKFNELSGGKKRRVMLAKAMVQQPDILLLDEPTNHLDIESIEWLENYLLGLKTTLIIVSHDRAFIDKLCTRIIELDRGKLTSYTGGFKKYLDLKEKAEKIEDEHNAKFDKKLAQEEVWIRKGIQARRTRNEGRVRALMKLREQRHQRRDRLDKATIELNQANHSGKVVVRAKNIEFAYANEKIVHDFSCKIMRGDKVGIIGPNGCGKTTLVKLLLGELKLGSGSVRLGTNLQIAYLDQHRSSIRDDWSVQDNVSGNDQIEINGKQKHILSYLQDFLFEPSRARAPAAKLSGGERNRLVLAKIFTQPFNCLVLDEPTNDLDYETLELLEQLLMEFSGTLFLVSHDRAFLDNVVTNTIVFEGDARWSEYIGGYTDWRRQSLNQKLDEGAKKATIESKKASSSTPNSSQKISTKLSYNYHRELDSIPSKIEEIESKIKSLSDQMSEADFFDQGPEKLRSHNEQLSNLQAQLDQLMLRWEELETM